MIDIRNIGSDLSNEDRLTGINRALHSYPYFYSTSFDLTNGDTEFQEHRIGIDRDFYITGIQSKLAQLNLTTGYELSLYAGYYDSVTRTPYQQFLPQSLIAYEAHEADPNGILCSKQFEIPPYLVKAGDFAYVNLRAKVSDPQIVPLPVVLKGFATLNGQTVSNETKENITEQLTIPVTYDWFRVRATPGNNPPLPPPIGDFTKRIITLENDRFPRLLLGAATEPDIVRPAAEMSITITDTARRLRLTNEPIPYSFLGPQMLFGTAPELGQQDYIYWLPVEYYWGPYAQIQIEVSYHDTNGFNPINLEFALFTRTV